ncbi:hypothetical protein FJ250_09065 [bacterium]|nr:hypothetical protein [bacterium]
MRRALLWLPAVGLALTALTGVIPQPGCGCGHVYGVPFAMVHTHGPELPGPYHRWLVGQMDWYLEWTAVLLDWLIWTAVAGGLLLAWRRGARHSAGVSLDRNTTIRADAACILLCAMPVMSAAAVAYFDTIGIVAAGAVSMLLGCILVFGWRTYRPLRWLAWSIVIEALFVAAVFVFGRGAEEFTLMQERLFTVAAVGSLLCFALAAAVGAMWWGRRWALSHR